MFWRKKNKGRKWRRPDGACVSAEKGGSHFNLFLFFQTSFDLALKVKDWGILQRLPDLPQQAG